MSNTFNRQPKFNGKELFHEENGANIELSNVKPQFENEFSPLVGLNNNLLGTFDVAGTAPHDDITASSIKHSIENIDTYEIAIRFARPARIETGANSPSWIWELDTIRESLNLTTGETSIVNQTTKVKIKKEDLPFSFSINFQETPLTNEKGTSVIGRVMAGSASIIIEDINEHGIVFSSRSGPLSNNLPQNAATSTNIQPRIAAIDVISAKSSPISAFTKQIHNDIKSKILLNTIDGNTEIEVYRLASETAEGQLIIPLSSSNNNLSGSFIRLKITVVGQWIQADSSNNVRRVLIQNNMGLSTASMLQITDPFVELEIQQIYGKTLESGSVEISPTNIKLTNIAGESIFLPRSAADVVGGNFILNVNQITIDFINLPTNPQNYIVVERTIGGIIL